MSCGCKPMDKTDFLVVIVFLWVGCGKFLKVFKGVKRMVYDYARACKWCFSNVSFKPKADIHAWRKIGKVKFQSNN